MPCNAVKRQMQGTLSPMRGRHLSFAQDKIDVVTDAKLVRSCSHAAADCTMEMMAHRRSCASISRQAVQAGPLAGPACMASLYMEAPERLCAIIPKGAGTAQMDAARLKVRSSGRRRGSAV